MAPFFIGLLSVLLGIVSVLIVLIVLMQRPKQEGLGAAFGGGMTDQMFGAQTSNVLQKGTVYLAVLFFVFSLILSVLTAKTVRSNTDVVESLADGKDEAAEKPIDEIPGASGITAPPIQIPAKPADASKTDEPKGGAVGASIGEGVGVIVGSEDVPEVEDAAEAVEGAVDSVTDKPGE